jgi:anthranilate/para-aminobenzoate synthase component II
MNKPKILIYCNVYDTTVGQGTAYMRFFSQFGDVLLVTTEMNLPRFIEEADILALPGGQDLYSGYYGSKPGFDSRMLNHQYEYLDQNLLKPWLATKKPIIGICRGMQALNVYMGGTLHPHVVNHVQPDKYDRDDRPHEMYTNLSEHVKIYPINSYHHQAVKDVAEGFEVLGWSDVYVGCPSLRRGHTKFKEYGYSHTKDRKATVQSEKKSAMLPELMRHKTLPYIAFQYHPEEFMCHLAIQLIDELIKNYENQKINTITTASEQATA